MKIGDYSYENEGMGRVYENSKWTVGVKNWKPSSDMVSFDRLERYNQTDEQFILLEGEAVILFAEETEEGLQMEAVPMKKNRVYSVPATLWHNTVTGKNAKLILVEDSNTTVENSELRSLTEEEIREYHRLLKEFR